jgi:hypothetical protein
MKGRYWLIFEKNQSSCLVCMCKAARVALYSPHPVPGLHGSTIPLIKLPPKAGPCQCNVAAAAALL